MADLLDQYENIVIGGGYRQRGFQSADADYQEPISSGYVSVKTEETPPIFKKEIKNFRPPNKIVDLTVSNNIVVIGLETNQVKRLDLTNPSDMDRRGCRARLNEALSLERSEIVRLRQKKNRDIVSGSSPDVEVSKRPDDSIQKLFLDPTGRHLIICMRSLESFYLGRNNKKTKALQKLKNIQVESVGWNKVNMNETTTGEILIGTTKGLIFETEIEAEEKFLIQMGAERYFKQLYNTNENRDEEEPVTGLHLERFPYSERRFLVMVTTKSRMYQFIGEITVEPPIFATVFTVYDPNPAPFLELPGMLDHSDLTFYFPKPKGPPKLFAWLTGPGVYFGALDFHSQGAKDNITTETRLLPPTEVKPESPMAISLTEFHCVLLYSDRIEAICILNDEEVFIDSIPPRFGPALGLRTDYARKTLWAFTDSAVFQYHVIKEDRDVWKMYLDKGQFDLAKDFCKDNPAKMDLVLRKQAEQLFEDKQYRQAATYYALTQISFEEVALKFIQVKERESLKMFLLKKMVNLKQQDRTQMTMIVTWLIELYLNQLGELRDQGDKSKVDFDMLQEEFRKFLAQTRVKTCLEQNKQVAYDLLSSHGDTENMIFFAMLMQDYERVISHHIQQDDFSSALEVLKTKKETTNLFYKFSPVLMQHIPKETVEAWKHRELEPRKLIPALVTHEQNTKTATLREAIDFLEHCVYKLRNTDEAIHNYLISLYCKLDDQAPLLRYLNGQGEDRDSVSYDLKYALRLCSEHSKEEGCVHIYSTMGLYEEAVELALKVDIEKAKLFADKPEDDDVLKKKLWLKVARHVVEKEQNIGRAMELLNECGLLKIEDILPFFPDFVTIDQFKDAICRSLQEYNQHIDELKEAMQEATESAKVVRTEIHEIRNRYGTIAAQEKCALCYYPLLTRSFYYFPCSHVFHSDCLITEVMQHLKERQRHKVEEIQSKLANISSASLISAAGTTAAGGASSREQLKAELDDLVASECLFCGDIMIRTLDKPFIDPDEFESVMDSWK